MSQRIRRFGIGQTAKVAAVLYALMGLLFVPIYMAVASALPKGTTPPRGLILMLPVVYAVLGFIVVAIACAVYNLVAGLVGGVEVELEGSSSTT